MRNYSVIELVISIRDAEKKRLTKHFLVYEPFTLDTHDPIVDKYLTECINEFNGEPDEVKLKAIMVMQ